MSPASPRPAPDAPYTGSDFCCDVAIPDPGALDVVHLDERVVEQTHGAAAVLTNLGDYQDSKHLHVHVHSGPRREERRHGVA